MPLSTLLIDLHYLPSLEYFACLFPHHTIQIETQEFYQKQTYRNRCYILTSQKVDCLTVPVRQSGKKTPYRTKEIDYCQPWEELHWRAICAAYGKAPYFKYFSEYFRTVLLRRYTYLFDLNLALLQTCLQLLQLEKKIELSKHDEIGVAKYTADARHSILPRNRLSHRTYCHTVWYQQVFGKTFQPNLSIIDLLFCQGHNAYTILQQATANDITNKERR
ncbi:MAG: WbqC family protein [Amoebophilaceae bacterium]|nr:WbqC family protein [Amoebophilaceae bacterium]